MALKHRAVWSDHHVEITKLPDPDHQPINAPPVVGPLPPQGVNPAPGAQPPYQLPQTTSVDDDDVLEIEE